MSRSSKREMNTEVLYKLLDDFNNGILPHAKEQAPVTTSGEFGWLSGLWMNFLESPLDITKSPLRIFVRKKAFWKNIANGKKQSEVVRIVTAAGIFCRK